MIIFPEPLTSAARAMAAFLRPVPKESTRSVDLDRHGPGRNYGEKVLIARLVAREAGLGVILLRLPVVFLICFLGRHIRLQVINLHARQPRVHSISDLGEVVASLLALVILRANNVVATLRGRVERDRRWR